MTLPAACRVPEGSARPALVYGSLLEPNTLNPLLAPDISSRQAIELVFDGLVAANSSLELVPRLAEWWETAADGMTWTFHLRRNVTWQDGAAFSADDVVFTYATLLDPASGATLARADYSAIERVWASNESTVHFLLRRAYAPFLARLTVGIVPKHLLAGRTGKDLASSAFNRQPVGTGPYRLKQWQAGQRLTFEANPAYYLGAPAIGQIVWKIVPDSSALTLQLLGGEVNASMVPDPLDRARLRADSRFQLAEAPGGNTQVSFRLTNPLFSDSRVRRALALALDVPAIVEGVLRGEGTLATSDIPPTSWARDPSVQPIKRDLTEARRLFAEAGWLAGSDGVLRKDGRAFSFRLQTYAGDRVREAVLLVIQQQWRELGALVEVGTQERNSFIAGRVLTGDFEAALLESAVQIDPDLSRRFHSAEIGQGQNFLAYGSSALDALLDRGVGTLDRESRRGIYAAAERVLLADMPQIPLFFSTQAYALPSGLDRAEPTPLGLFWNAAEWRLR